VIFFDPEVVIREPLVVLDKDISFRCDHPEGAFDVKITNADMAAIHATDAQVQLALDYVAFLIRHNVTIYSGICCDAGGREVFQSEYWGWLFILLLQGERRGLKPKSKFGVSLERAKATVKIGAYVLMLKGDLSKYDYYGLTPRRQSELQRYVDKLLKAFANGKRDAERSSIVSADIAEVEFLSAEYRKRRFVLDTMEDEELRGLAQRSFDLLRSAYERWAEEEGCSDCPWRTMEILGAEGWPYIMHSQGCGPYSCRFKVMISKGIDLFGRAIGQTPDGVVGKFDLYSCDVPTGIVMALGECFKLAKRYGLYPYDLFTLTNMETISFGNGSILAPNFYWVPSCEWSEKPEKAQAALEAVYEDRKKQLGTGKFHKQKEGRLIGLWVWDKTHLRGASVKVNQTALIKEMYETSWFQSLPLGPTQYEQYKNNTQVNYQNTIESHRDSYYLANLCAQEGRIVPGARTIIEEDGSES